MERPTDVGLGVLGLLGMSLLAVGIGLVVLLLIPIYLWDVVREWAGDR